jgi:hypothetical protein
VNLLQFFVVVLLTVLAIGVFHFVSAQKTADFFHRIGRRGAVLQVLSVAFAAYGYSLIALTRETEAALPVDVMAWVFPIDVWGGAWLATAVVGLYASFRAKANAMYAYALYTGMASFWGLGMLASHFLQEPYDPRGWVAGAVFSAFGVLLLIISGWREGEYLPYDDSDIQ